MEHYRFTNRPVNYVEERQEFIAIHGRLVLGEQRRYNARMAVSQNKYCNDIEHGEQHQSTIRWINWRNSQLQQIDVYLINSLQYILS